MTSPPAAATSPPKHAASPPAQTPAPANIEIDAGGSEDNDSTYGESISSLTTSLTSSITNYQYENGRRYHAYREGAYVFPNDEKENDRMDIHHHLAVLGLEGKLHTAPIGEKPQSILDLGTGTGIWAIDMADEYPSAQVLGVDLSPTQPRLVPPNMKFEVDDIEDSWTYSQQFDLVHARFLAAAVQDWPKLIKQTFKQTKPGGFAEFQDWDSQIHADDDSLPPENPLAKYHALLFEACDIIGRDAHPGPKLKGYLEAAGFVNVTEKMVIMPLGVWPKDKKLKELGAWNLLQLQEGIEGLAMALLTRVSKWQPEEVQVLLAQVRPLLKSRDIHGYYRFYYTYGQKPEEPAATH
jgi:ubiquinone/menaquinone biosynthesis C-methylase UbiE